MHFVPHARKTVTGTVQLFGASAEPTPKYRLRISLQHLRQFPQRTRCRGKLLEHALEFLWQCPRAVQQLLHLRQVCAGLLGHLAAARSVGSTCCAAGASASLVRARLESSCGSAGSSTIRRAAEIRLSSPLTTCSSGRADRRLTTCPTCTAKGSIGTPAVGISSTPGGAENNAVVGAVCLSPIFCT